MYSIIYFTYYITVKNRTGAKYEELRTVKGEVGEPMLAHEGGM